MMMTMMERRLRRNQGRNIAIYIQHTFRGKNLLKKKQQHWKGELKQGSFRRKRHGSARASRTHAQLFFEVNIQENQNLGKYLTASIRFAWQILGTDVPPTECAHIRKLMFEQNFNELQKCGTEKRLRHRGSTR